MEEMNKQMLEVLLKAVPGGIAKLAFDDMLSILYATENFYSLVKNVTDKTSTQTPVSLLRMVYSADVISLTRQIAAQKNRKDNMINLNFRTLQQDGSFKWVMITGNKTEEQHQSGSKTVPVYYCIAMDITNHMVSYKRLEQTNDYHRIISELSRDLFFEYEIATDTLSFSELFREMFGKDSTITGFRKRLEKTKTIHSDELPAIISIYNSMMSGRKLARFELRLISKDGKPIWYTCYASIILDENKNPYKVVGKLTIMNVATKEEHKTDYVPQMDPISNVCTKDSVEHMISEATLKQEENELSALMLVDIRNFKGLNEIRRAIQEENIFTTIGRVLKKHLRSGDMIGRLGLSEFIIYAKGISSDKAAYELANQICKEIDTLHPYEHSKNGITASIGIALHRGVQEYSNLMANANAALVMAKKTPTSTFETIG